MFQRLKGQCDALLLIQKASNEPFKNLHPPVYSLHSLRHRTTSTFYLSNKFNIIFDFDQSKYILYAFRLRNFFYSFSRATVAYYMFNDGFVNGISYERDKYFLQDL
jgi:hypothetical protein